MKRIVLAVATAVFMLGTMAAGCASTSKVSNTPITTAATPSVTAAPAATAAPSTAPPCPPQRRRRQPPPADAVATECDRSRREYLSLGSGFSQVGLIGQLDSPTAVGSPSPTLPLL